ncbi:molybdopterin converting factor subunit 1 [Pseudoalteromonas haloplanktis]|uniref:Molybdopterin synthase sulfur carrier subunit n=1 Tax=Pseudoalteromonas haloplanktis TaxID=228 RepID=A0ABU1B6U6_PSEHA|nr:molybdopterin converting factor subunit 1 [Pseudoalteromonas haloplanktis]MDQ9090156.1 molybdopterin converting factor subunit 1 [Pseudoalteromonas haloplanktis]
MITLLFFGRLRELLACERLSLSISNPVDVATLRQMISDKGPQWQKFTTSQHALVAVNQTMAQEHTIIKAGDEVALFPPVTGG